MFGLGCGLGRTFGLPRLDMSTYMNAQTDGAWFDFERTDRHFIEGIGPSLAGQIGDGFGLTLDQRQWAGKTLPQVEASAAQLLTNGDFSTGSGWTGTGWTISGGEAVHAAGAGTQKFSQNISLLADGVHRVSFDVTESDEGGFLALRIGDASNNIPDSISNAAGSYLYYVRASTVDNKFAFRAGNALDVKLDNASCKIISRYCGKQGSSSLRPVRQTTGARFDGADDVLPTNYLAGSGANFIAARITVPETISAMQVFVGSSGASTERAFLAINTSGKMCGGVGSQSTSTIVGTSDVRGTDATVCLSWNGSSVRLFVDQALEYEAAQSGTATTTVPFHIGALNSNGSAANFFAGSVRELAIGRELIDLETWRRMRTTLIS